MHATDLSGVTAKAGELNTLRLVPKNCGRLADGQRVDLLATAMETHERAIVPAVARGGRLEAEFVFGKEQEYLFSLDGAEAARVYCLDGDLAERTPYKGDFHIHSDRSDGTEPPERVAALARGIGMDFLAITDHRDYRPSLDAIDAFADYGGDMLLLPGEEIHPPGNPVHIINFGGAFSVNALFDEAYAAEVARLAADSGLAGAAAHHYAGCRWCFAKVAEAGGISLLCHPHWVTANRYNVDAGLLDRLFADGGFSAFELLGGHECESNALQVAYWQQKRAEGLRVPIVGVSDAHQTYRGGDYFGWTYTVAFAHALSLAGLRESVASGFTAAVEHLPGEHPRVHGNYRLVKYALFLLREHFPRRDRLCALDSENMLNHLEKKKENACAML